jgi:hypothetical protein
MKNRPPENPANPRTHLSRHRDIIAARVRDLGIRRSADAAGICPMRASRYARHAGANDADTHYALAAATGCTITMSAGSPPPHAAKKNPNTR